MPPMTAPLSHPRSSSSSKTRRRRAVSERVAAILLPAHGTDPQCVGACVHADDRTELADDELGVGHVWLEPLDERPRLGVIVRGGDKHAACQRVFHGELVQAIDRLRAGADAFEWGDFAVFAGEDWLDAED